jgi:isopentenyl phosphate kinase
MEDLVFLKLGGSLITEKTKPYTPRLDKLRSLAAEIREASRQVPQVTLILGHGSGSFGHYAVQQHLNASAFPPVADGRPRSETEYWKGFAEVWFRASELNRHVIGALHAAGVTAVAHSASSAATTSGGGIKSWDIASLRAAVSSGVVPVIFGDIVFDDRLGGKVLSTESLMMHLAHEMKPRRILLAGIEGAVWEDYPDRTRPIRKITPSTFSELSARVGGSHGPDVTGGMESKVTDMLSLVQSVSGLSVRIFSGEEEGNVGRALAGEELGTLIVGD